LADESGGDADEVEAGADGGVVVAEGVANVKDVLWLNAALLEQVESWIENAGIGFVDRGVFGALDEEEVAGVEAEALDVGLNHVAGHGAEDTKRQAGGVEALDGDEGIGLKRFPEAVFNGEIGGAHVFQCVGVLVEERDHVVERHPPVFAERFVGEFEAVEFLGRGFVVGPFDAAGAHEGVVEVEDYGLIVVGWHGLIV